MNSLKCYCSIHIPYKWNTKEAHRAEELGYTQQSGEIALKIPKFHTHSVGSSSSSKNIYINNRKITFFYYIYIIQIADVFNSKTKAKLGFVNIPYPWNFNGTIAISGIIDTHHRGPTA